MMTAQELIAFEDEVAARFNAGRIRARCTCTRATKPR